ncbi:hypothetical protein SAMN04487775_10882 [Treponema bryantii]|uniref:DUF3795 domain-containing protein n=1 Tax=Treponema bryantii TaxID=163 RepID=A0A1I3M7B9_9SPIR|nr:DUF3795 domain-containing protein [Treponema bryantii]SFI92635.1 hypothetical protein SAMN04487775_10882 [Treponema bryantii]
MNKDWSEKNKKMQALISKEATFAEGIKLLLELRAELFEQISFIVKTFPSVAFYQLPFGDGEGNHCTTLAWSLWHTFRIEDIVSHELILKNKQILFDGEWLERTGSVIITTGNELAGDILIEFSKKLDIKATYDYCKTVMDSTNEMLEHLKFEDLKKTFTGEDRERLVESKCVSSDERASWLIDYWCSKNIKGLIQMPFSRHWIMHVEAMRRIKNKLCQHAKKGVDQIAYCGLSCGHCFLTSWCGSCRTIYNTCSYATCSPDGVCPNVACCKEKGLDGCYECDELYNCKKGFYSLGKDTNAIRAMALFIQKYGKKELLRVMDTLHKNKKFEKIQEVLGDDVEEGLKIMEEWRGK